MEALCRYIAASAAPISSSIEQGAAGSKRPTPMLSESSYGHAEGDQALVDAARILEANLRESDFIARIGGDEFCCVLSGSNEVQDSAAVARIEAANRRHNATAGRPYELSFSVGVARFDPANPTTIEEILRAADAAMYRDKAAKHSGG